MDVHKLTEEFGQDHLRDKCGLPLATYFSATKLSWLLSNVPEVTQISFFWPRRIIRGGETGFSPTLKFHIYIDQSNILRIHS